MAATTVGLTGHVLTPDSSAVTSGTIDITLSTAGSALDGASSERIPGGRFSGPSQRITLGAAGALPVGAKIVPNDAITPSGTYYTAKFTCYTGASTTVPVVWTEYWQLVGMGASVAIGAIPRLNAPTLGASQLLAAFYYGEASSDAEQAALIAAGVRQIVRKDRLSGVTTTTTAAGTTTTTTTAAGTTTTTAAGTTTTPAGTTTTTTTTPGAPFPYSNDFSNAATLSDFTLTGSGWSITGGKLRFSGSAGDNYACYTPTAASGSVQASINMNNTGEFAGLVLAASSLNSTEFLLSVDFATYTQLSIYRIEGGTGSGTPLGSLSSQSDTDLGAISKNAPFTLRLQLSGTTLKGSLNGVEKFSLTTTALTAGRAGVRAYSGGAAITYDFDDLAIT